MQNLNDRKKEKKREHEETSVLKMYYLK